ncbi:alpha-N-acetyl-neuraminyl-2,3-beta-galactosyl-1,3-N-acetyl-galactosaminide alpha-2,6-sialyltransferase isoform X6 [Ovis aries]|uniref:alpha-N-acetyl-neuraminyl-2,3-beta-galactosyl-1, 3-N-acetyl-galactosaminide alpha-2,6-sialyltransferase isoform X6 n=1 Tax=Ovis aries TaxID=9940 RepID=UPI001C2EFC13|nr:alpha-N-acetyl-neuraminyl-2,3-beta-galactosyl-1,3-N-acetyl-galactosaminide alpha-2,6-sialyltransferase isoform X6 [Ovis aries]
MPVLMCTALYGSPSAAVLRRRLLLIVLCSVGFSAVYILLCCWACLPFCSAFCLDPHLSIKSRPTVPGPLHFSGYSSVPDGKVYTFTERMMAYCDQVFQDETGKNRRQSGSFLSTGWFTMILALELCEEIVVYGMVSDSYCSQEGKSPSPFYRWVIEAQGVCLGLESPSSLARGRSITPRCLTTTSRRAGWTSVKCTWRMSGRPAAPTASSPRRPCSLAGPRRGPSSLPTHPGGRSGPIATAPSPGLCCSHTPPKTLNLWILPSAMCRVDLSSLPAIPLGTLGSHLGLLDLGREEEASGDLCSLLPTPAP